MLETIAQTSAPLARLIVEVSAHYGISTETLLGRRRMQHVAHARLLVYWLAYEVLGLSSPTVGELLGRDHATVLYGVESFRGTMDVCESTRRIAAHFRQRAVHPVSVPLFAAA